MAKVVRFSALVATGGALSFAVFFSNCGGSDGMRAGSAGSSGMGTAGTTGSGGSGGGTAGVTGAGGRFTCPTDQTLDCSASAALTLMSGHVTTFSAEEWSPTDGKYCNASALRGSVFSYSGPEVDGGNISSNSHGVDSPAGNYRLTLMAGPGGYAGGGISFDRCVNAGANANALRFTAWIASGDLTGCNFKAQMQTFEQRPTSQSPPGACDSAAMSCFNFPSGAVALTTSPTVFTIPFASMTGATHTNPFQGQVVGLQWQVESGPPVDPDAGIQLACTVEIRIDEIDFVTQ
jgi:hypothetical protein